jgi:plasmid replication initiation protein
MADLSLRADYLIQKSRVLNLLKAKREWGIREQQFFLAYLAKIDARFPDTNRVRFSLEEFKKLFEVKELKPNKVEPVIDNMLGQVMIDSEYGEELQMKKKSYTLFNFCKIDKNNNDEWYVDISASKEAMHLMFDLQNYFGYRLENVLRLGTVQQIRMYEILKHHEHNGYCEYTLEELREHICDNKNAHPDYRNLKRKILDNYQMILKRDTDIEYTYEAIRKGRGAPVVAIKFYISENKEYSRQIHFDMYENTHRKEGGS